MKHRRSVRWVCAVVIAIGVAAWLKPTPGAARANVNVTFGDFTTLSAWPAGPDYATDVLADPWDMSNTEDIGQDPTESAGWNNLQLANGLVGGTTSSPDSTVVLLNRGRWNFIDATRSGRRYPIDSSYYQKLAFRMSSNSTTPTNNIPQVYWFHYPWEQPGIDPATDGYGAQAEAASPMSGFKIWVTNLTTNNQGPSPWANGLVRGMRIDPNGGDPAGRTYFIDWVRLTAADNAPGAAIQHISWSGCAGSAPTLRATDASIPPTTFDIATLAAGTTSYAWNYGVLPPASGYALTVVCGSNSGSKAFNINNPPIVHVIDPDETGGEDFATTVLGNSWDMSGPEDYAAAFGVIAPPTFANGQLTATSDSSGDPQIWFLNQTDLTTSGIDTSRYRYLTFHLQVDGTFDLGLGSVARVFWSAAQFFNGGNATVSQDIAAWPGMTTYTFDLGALTTGPDGGLEDAGSPQVWTSARMHHLRIDPHEFPQNRTFHFGSIKLAAMDETVNGQFTIQWAGLDPDSASPTVTLYYAPQGDRDPSHRTQIQPGLPLSGSWVWNTSGVTPGIYDIYAQANDGIQTYGRYSTGSVRVLSLSATSSPAMSLDTPANGSTVLQPLPFSGWAIDRGAPSGVGVDQVTITAQPAGGGAVMALGNAGLFGQRPDVGAVFGSQFTNAGFNGTVTGLSPGTYVMTASAESTVSGTFNQARSVTVTIPSPSPAMSLDVPSNNAVVGPSFTLAGWAIDRGAPSGTGVNQIAVWAVPSAGGSPVNLGVATYGQVRSDVGQVFGSQFTNAGYSLTISSLPPGAYDIRASAYSLVAGGFNQERWVHVTVGASASNPLMVVDLPANDSTVGTTLSIAGWGIDRGATSGTGVDAVVVWAFPINGTPFPLGATNYGGVRNDIANAFGAQFRNSGFTLNVPSPAPGTYDLRLSLHSTVANTYNLERWTRVTVSATGSNPRMFVDQPTSGATIGQPFTLSGWAVDLGAPSGTGVDAIEVWAFPTNGSQPFRVGAASYGSARPDIGSAFGTAFTNSGYALSVSNLPAHGTYDLRVSARSTVTGSFNQEQWIRITIP